MAIGRSSAAIGIKFTTSDDQTLFEALNAAPEELELWLAAVDDEL